MRTILAEIITIGDEILIGQITDTNTQYISAELSLIGIKTQRKSSVGDSENDILDILSEASQRVDLIILTGGLGPTKDDITKNTLAKFFNVGWKREESVLKHVTDFFEKRGREMLQINEKQADIPENATLLFNSLGTAPGMWFEYQEKIYVSLPGVPYEMKHLMAEKVLPKLKTYFNPPSIYHKMIHVVGIGESFLADIIKDWEDSLPEYLKLAYLPSIGTLKLRISSYASDQNIVNEVADRVEKLKTLIEPYIFGYDQNGNLASAIGQKLITQNLTLSCAESCTGGYLAHLITSVAGSSSFFKGGIVSYANEIKQAELNVVADTIAQHGAVSEEVVLQMAANCRLKFNTDIAVATSGVAGPSGGTDEKPVGTVWIAFSSSKITFAKKFLFTTKRENNIHLSAIAALNMIRQNS